jgi:Uma2 family endonuclease
MDPASPPSAPGASATVEDLREVPDAERFHEIIDGELVQKAHPSGEHGDAQSAVAARIKGPFQRRPGGKWPGGWWIYTEVEIEFSRNQVYRPDAAGWRRERVPERPIGAPITVLPDWVCEIISPSKPARDLIQKKRTYHQRQVPHYWLIDPRDETLTVLRWSPDGYIEVLLAQRGDRVRAEPFAAIELPVGVFFGDDAED